MPLSRRCARASLSALAFSAIAPFAGAQAQAAWPTRPVRIIVTFPPGGAPDTLARVLAEKWASLGQTVTVENKPGAGGNIGADMVAKAPGDGHTLVLGTVGTHAINPSLYAHMPYDNIRDFTPISFSAKSKFALACERAISRTLLV